MTHFKIDATIYRKIILCRTAVQTRNPRANFWHGPRSSRLSKYLTITVLLQIKQQYKICVFYQYTIRSYFSTLNLRLECRGHTTHTGPMNLYRGRIVVF